MLQTDPIRFQLQDGTHVDVYEAEEGVYEFYLTRLNSEKHNFIWKDNHIEESYETRFDRWQNEAVEKFRERQNSDKESIR
jgi:hypothetical protein